MQAVLKNTAVVACMGAVLLLGACQHAQSSADQIALEEAQAMQKGCKPVKRGLNDIAIAATISNSGQFCLVRDLVQRKVLDLVDGSTRGSPSEHLGDGIIFFYETQNAVLDLQGHLASGTPFLNTNGAVITASKSSHITLKNGRIETPGPRSYGVVLAQNIYWNWQRASEPEVVPKVYKTDRPENDPPTINVRVGLDTKTVRYDYKTPAPDTYTLENLHITSGGRGVVLSGVNNVLRNSTVEVDSKTAVYLYGPGAVVEGNTFIVKLDPQDLAPLPAILKLRDAHGAIIRNNKFVVKAGVMTGLFPGKSEAAINLLESTNVLIENNEVHDNQVLVRKDAQSTTVERGNVLR